MSSQNSIALALTCEDFAKIRQLGNSQNYPKGAVIFSDGDEADHIYFIESGYVSIFIEKFTSREEISSLGPGDYFGEMAFFSGDRRSASAVALLDTTLVSIDKTAFLNLYDSDQDIAGRIDRIFAKRNEELSFREHLTRGKLSIDNESFMLGIKGDPSLRFSALSRERYDSVVDRIISDLLPRLYDLLTNRSVYEIVIHCNSGEMLIRNVFDPLNGEIHPASKLLNIAYIDRHFPALSYDEKSRLVKQFYEFIGDNSNFARLPPQLRESMQTIITNWEPVSQLEIAEILTKLPLLRKIPDFYLRNITLSIVSNTIRLQFNCDGTQIVNARGLQDFIEQNLDEEEEHTHVPVERRMAQRRCSSGQISRHSEHRSPMGRRREDWTKFSTN
ncbi:MAG: cyclic nucleotide-binding domain-containing protein [Burkholderiales bacterium]